MSNKISIFDYLNILSTGDIEKFNSLSHDEKKSFANVVIMRWLTGCKCEDQIIRINEYCNTIMFKLHKHDDMIRKLMMLSCDGTSKKYNWISRPKNTVSLKERVVMEYFTVSVETAKEYLKIISLDGLHQMATELSYDDKDIKNMT